MPNSEDVQPPPPDYPQAAEELLDESILSTVLDIVEAIETAEELALLETLTSAQKRQVWAALSDERKLRLKQIRQATNATPTDIAPPELNESLEESSLDLEADDLELPAELQDELEEITHAELDHSMAEQSEGTDRPRAKVGDRIVLLPKPQIGTVELMAIWDVVEIQEDNALIEAKQLGTRHYPLSWMVVYPEPDF